MKTTGFKHLFKILILFIAIHLNVFGPVMAGEVVDIKAKQEKYTAYLFAYFVGNGPGQEAVHYALSTDGYNYRALNNNKPVLDSKIISTSGGVRDPHILRGNDGMFYMVLTDLYVPEMGWQNYAMVLLKSSDLINWTHSIINVPETFPGNFKEVNRVWAPQTIYDEKKKKYMIYWSMRHNEDNDIIYYAYANDDFTALETEPKQLLYRDGACIDGDIVYKDGKYHMFFKNEGPAKGILKAVSDKVNEGYVVLDKYMDQTDDAVEGSGTFKIIGTDKYILMYDVYKAGKYQFCESTDLENFEIIDQSISMNFHPRHGSVIPITQSEMDALNAKWGNIDEGAIFGTNSPTIQRNLMVNDKEGTVKLFVEKGSDLTSIDPMWKVHPGATYSPKGPQNFTKGGVKYSVELAGSSKTYLVTVESAKNPVLDGYYADPEIIYSQKNKCYYLYPTSDGFTNWSGTFFETFSSTDLVNWKKEGKVLDLTKDVSWTSRNAWAPTAIEKKIGDRYKYFYYFTAGQQIGVAVSDGPTGPFVDSGRPLINFKPGGYNGGGQEIDPDVFTDPQTGKNYLYWGNMYMAVAELSEDMVSIDTSSIKLLTPDKSYREGTEVFFRKGRYYFLWSENDTRSPDYRVRYGISNSPTGPMMISRDNIVLEKDESRGIYGTGHNSVIQVPGRDEWYIVYHRFPAGVDKSDGFHRQVSIDKLEFGPDGNIIKVVPTITGITPVK